MPGKCHFREFWVTNAENKDIAKWLRPVENDMFRAFCKFCNSSFDVSHSGFNSVKSHQKGKIHQELAKALLSGKQTTITVTKSSTQQTTSALCIPAGPSVVPDISILDQQWSNISIPNTATLDKFVIGDEVTKAEILWAINKVMVHSSDRGASVSSDLFAVMFPDSIIAQKFKMHKDKLAYFIAYGLGPFFQNLLCKELNNCKYFCVAFDESLNRVSQKGQMDLIVRYWNPSSDEVSTRYLTSVFLGHSTAYDLLNGLTSSLAELGLPLHKIMQISMDGPNVNLKLLKDFQFLMKTTDNKETELIEIGTCSLHTVHCSYKTALQKSEWNIAKFLRAIYYLFKDFPSRRADYIRYSESFLFPKKMCSVRWVENSDVIERTIKILPHLKKYIDGVKANPPVSDNYHIVEQFLADKLLPAKLSFLQSVCVELEPFLTDFQSEKPLLPFLYNELFCMIRDIGNRFLAQHLQKTIKNAKQLLTVNVEVKENIMPLKDIDIGFGARVACKNIKEPNLTIFRRDCRDFLISIFRKLVSPKSPLHKAIVKGVSCLSPAVMLNSSIRLIRITLVLNELIQKNYVAPIEADTIKKRYISLCEEKHIQDKLKSFDWKIDRLDKLIKDMVLEDKEDPFFKFSKQILMMFHGNAAVERGFSVNKDCLLENLNERALVAQRCVYSAITSMGGIHKLNISKKMIIEVRKAGSRRKEALLEQKQQKDQEEKSMKHAEQEIAALKEKRKRLLENTEAEASNMESEIKALELKKRKY